MTDASSEVSRLLERLVREGKETGLQVAAYLDGSLVVDAWAGHADETAGRPVDGDTLFTAFSVSKGITATCVHLLADRGLVDYDAPIASYWPEFAAHGKEKATVRDALTHRAGIPQDPPGFDLSTAGDWDAVCRAVADLEPLWQPGTQTGYHALTYGWMLGEVVRRVDGRGFGRFLQEEVCEPLGIEAMYFGVPAEEEHRVATLAYAPGLAPLTLTLTPSLSDAAATMNRSEVRRAAIPGAGAIMNARSLARHYAVLAGGGELDGVRLLTPDRIAVATRIESDQGADPVLAGVMDWRPRWGLGYSLGGAPGAMAGRPLAFGYEGLGTIGFADPARNFAFAFLKNRLDWSADEMNSVTEVAHAVEQALGIG
jgi:CubicO group peptidase (beta-lactamase class C family)